MTRQTIAVILVFTALACTPAEDLGGRIAVGSVPQGFTQRPVSSIEDVVTYTQEYVSALRLNGLRVDGVLKFSDRYFVYVGEAQTGRSAFGLEIENGGGVRIKRFPAMDPEMMWNQKYGHRARRKTPGGGMETSLANATERAREALPDHGDVRLSPARSYYGYYLFSLREGERLSGEVAVRGTDGQVAWALFPEPPVASRELSGAPRGSR